MQNFQPMPVVPAAQMASCSNARRRRCACQGDCGCPHHAAPEESSCPAESLPCQDQALPPPCAPARPEAMVYPVNQRLEQLFRPAQALQAGTLFPELLKPMNGFAQPRTACANEKQAMAFSLWELRLYLDTHPQDQQALQIFHQLCSQTEAPNYACVWADACGQDHWAWIDQPWPWTFPGCGE